MTLRERVLATMAYYDALDMPLTEEMTERWLASDGGQRIAPSEVREVFGRLIAEGVISRRGEYYFLFNREYLVPLHEKNKAHATRKLELLKQYVPFIRRVPHVRAIFASGSLATGHASETSDLDILIVVRHGRLWTSRFLLLVLLSWLGVRRNYKHIVAPDKVCPNHFFTDQSLEMPFQSVYTARVLTQLLPLYVDDVGLLLDFQQANGWVKDHVEKWEMDRTHMLIGKTALGRFIEFFARSIILPWMGPLVSWYQKARISKNSVYNKAGRVVVSDQQLEFHPGNHEDNLITRYHERLKLVL